MIKREGYEEKVQEEEEREGRTESRLKRRKIEIRDDDGERQRKEGDQKERIYQRG